MIWVYDDHQHPLDSFLGNAAHQRTSTLYISQEDSVFERMTSSIGARIKTTQEIYNKKTVTI